MARHLVGDTTGELQKCDDRLVDVEKQERCLRRAVGLMFVTLLVGVGGAGHSAILLKEVTPDTFRLIVGGFSAIAIASLISLPVFSVLWMSRRTELGQRREDCRRATLRLISMHATVSSTASLPLTAVIEEPARLLNPPIA